MLLCALPWNSLYLIDFDAKFLEMKIRYIRRRYGAVIQLPFRNYTVIYYSDIEEPWEQEFYT
jgi:hypothetical protein